MSELETPCRLRVERFERGDGSAAYRGVCPVHDWASRWYSPEIDNAEHHEGARWAGMHDYFEHRNGHRRFKATSTQPDQGEKEQ